MVVMRMEPVDVKPDGPGRLLFLAQSRSVGFCCSGLVGFARYYSSPCSIRPMAHTYTQAQSHISSSKG